MSFDLTGMTVRQRLELAYVLYCVAAPLHAGGGMMMFRAVAADAMLEGMLEASPPSLYAFINSLAPANTCEYFISFFSANSAIDTMLDRVPVSKLNFTGIYTGVPGEPLGREMFVNLSGNTADFGEYARRQNIGSEDVTAWAKAIKDGTKTAEQIVHDEIAQAIADVKKAM